MNWPMRRLKDNVRLATAEDFQRFYGFGAPELWLGVVAEKAGRAVAMGSVVWSEHGQALVFFDRKGEASAFTLHRAARLVFDTLRSVGEPALFATCDASIPNAGRWMEKLGFQRMADTENTWRLDLTGNAP